MGGGLRLWRVPTAIAMHTQGANGTGAMLLKALGSVVIAVLASLLVFLFLGALPLLIQLLIHGSKDVYDSPGHGGAMLMLSIPFGGVAALGVFLFLTIRVYRKLSATKAQH